MEKLLELLGVQKLDESEQEVIKEKLNTLIEVKAQEMLESKLEEEKVKLIEAYEEKFEAYKEDITSKFSNFTDEILEQELQIPEKVLEFARKGELYSDLIEQFKVRLGVDEGLLDEEVKALLKEAKDEIAKGKKQIKEYELAAEVYLHRKAQGLTEGQKEHVMEMLDGVTDREEIDRKFDIIVEAYNGNDNGKNGDDDDDEDDDDKKKKKKKNGKNGDDDEDMDEKKKNESKDGKGEIEPKPDEKDDLNEDDDSPFSQHLKGYVQVLQENKV